MDFFFLFIQISISCNQLNIQEDLNNSIKLYGELHCDLFIFDFNVRVYE